MKMEIIIITGQQNGNLYLAGNYEYVKYFPEEKILHPYKLSKRILELCDRYFKANKDLVIATYSEIVLDSIRLWGARTGNCNILKCITYMDNGEVHTSTFDEYGEMDTWEHGVFDIKKVILKELLDIKRKKVNDKIMNS
jgi:hypothetical protein